ncbi:aldehyde ferredoxin oxidoreductase family protein [Candidatus Bipolaricaulota bacterium]|nr:aldehyde ferredoxin oxidoreductase family protein [Candidatus Bipolaricaulota bacterium]
MDRGLTRVLFVDLSRHAFRVEEQPDLFQNGLGGIGVAVELLRELCPQGTDPFSPENPVILAVGPLSALFPLASKTVAAFKSPHTGNLGESHCGGRTALAIRLAGYGAIVITGKSEIPVYLVVDEKGVHFRDARALWGLSSSFTVGRIIREREGGSGLRSILRIGQAGENLVSYANVVAESYRHFGRLGLGAVFGSKRLKALVIMGRRRIPVADKPGYSRLYRELHEKAVRSELFKKYHDLGTPQNVRPLNAIGALPVKNLKETRYPGDPPFAGETMAERYLGRRLACAGCPVACIHLAALREPYPDEPFFYKTTFVSYDYEPIYSLGTMLGGEDPEGYLKLMDEVEHLALDAMTCGVVLAWATEAFERGLITERDTGGLVPRWGDYDVYIEMVRRIAQRRGELYDVLARGVEEAAKRYGGEEFALAFGGNEMPGYHTGPGAHLTFLSGARHSHLDSAGYAVDQACLKEGRRLSPQELARALFSEEARRQVLSSLVLCFFARGLYDLETISNCLKVVGLDWDQESLEEFGKETLRRKYAFKVREGFDLKELRIPRRITETPTPFGRLEEVELRSALEEMGRLLAG